MRCVLCEAEGRDFRALALVDTDMLESLTKWRRDPRVKAVCPNVKQALVCRANCYPALIKRKQKKEQANAVKKM